MFCYAHTKCILELTAGLRLELTPAAFFKTWKTRTTASLPSQLSAKKARRRKKARSTCFHAAYSQSSEATASVLSVTLDYVRRLILGTAYERGEVVRRERLLHSGLSGQQLELRFVRGRQQLELRCVRGAAAGAQVCEKRAAAGTQVFERGKNSKNKGSTIENGYKRV